MGNPKYKIVIVKNKKIKKTIQTYKSLVWAKKRYERELKDNVVVFPKQYVNTKRIKKVGYEILLVKKTSKKDVIENEVYNDYGFKVKQIIKGGWMILKKDVWLVEETFHVYGLKDRLTVPQILKNIFFSISRDFYYITKVHNKLVIYNDHYIEVILCKNLNETERLHDSLKMFFLEKKLINFIFLGKADHRQRRALYDRMQEHTGLVRQELFRTSTRS